MIKYLVANPHTFHWVNIAGIVWWTPYAIPSEKMRRLYDWHKQYPHSVPSLLPTS